MSEKPSLDGKHPDLIEYDHGVAYFIKDFDFCCENPWDYITNNGDYPEYWDDHDSDYDAIEYFLEDRGWRKILDRFKSQTLAPAEAKQILEAIGGLKTDFNHCYCPQQPHPGPIYKCEGCKIKRHLKNISPELITKLEGVK